MSCVRRTTRAVRSAIRYRPSTFSVRLFAVSRKYFGTDGVRGVAGEPPLTPEFVLKLGQAAGAYYN